MQKVYKTDGIFKALFWSGWVKQSGHEAIQGKSEFYWPFYSNPRFNRELTKFMFSFRTEESANRNINNLMFVTGPEESGKSWLLKHNLEKFKKAKTEIQPLLVHLDLKKLSAVNFDTFLDLYEMAIINCLTLRSNDMLKGQRLLTLDTLFDVFFYNHDKLYYELKLSEILQSPNGLLDFNPENIKSLLGKLGIRVIHT